MIKSLKKYQIQTTPFEATKNWALNNTDNTDLTLMEDDSPVALEFIDYGDGSGYPYDNSFCDIALEQQSDDRATLEEGLKVTGPFYPESDPQNEDGTYKRSIYYQVRTMFYNDYLDPSKIWGLENIDFELSKTKRRLTDRFRMVIIPRNVFGDKITPKSVVVSDNTLDVEYQVTDDGNGNLFAGPNLFSRRQEVGEWENVFEDRDDGNCADYWSHSEPVYYDSTTSSVAFLGGVMYNQLRTDTASMFVGFVYGTAQDFPYTESAISSVVFYTGSVIQTTYTIPITGSAPPDTMSLEVGLFSGNVIDTTQVISTSIDTSSVEVGFMTGSYNLTTFVVTMSADGTTSSFDDSYAEVGFLTGSYTFVAHVLTMSISRVTGSVAFYQGSLINI